LLQSAHFLLRVCSQKGAFRFWQGDCRWWLVRVNPEVMSQLFTRLVAAQTKQVRHKVDHVAGGSAAETVKVPRVQLHAGMPVIVKRTTGYAVSAGLQPIIGRSLRNTDNLFYQLKPCHYCSLPSERKYWVPFFTIEPLFLALPAQSLYNVDTVPEKVIWF